MLLNTQTISKRTSRRSSKPRIYGAKALFISSKDAEYWGDMPEDEIEYVKNMWAARYMAMCELFIAAFVLFAFVGTYIRDGHVQSAFIEIACVVPTAMIWCAAYQWYKTSDFFAELKKNKMVRKHARPYRH